MQKENAQRAFFRRLLQYDGTEQSVAIVLHSIIFLAALTIAGASLWQVLVRGEDSSLLGAVGIALLSVIAMTFNHLGRQRAASTLSVTTLALAALLFFILLVQEPFAALWVALSTWPLLLFLYYRSYRQTLESHAALFQESARTNNAKHRLLQVSVHELNSALHPIKGIAQVLTHYADNADSKFDLKTLCNNLNTCIANIQVPAQNILSWEKSEEGKDQDLQMETVSLFGLVQQIVDQFQYAATLRHVKIELWAPEDFPMQVITDPQKVRSIATNLLSNALKFAARNTSIHMNLDLHGENWVLSVQDEGVGIPEAKRERIFEAFVSSTSALVNVEGSGLGLSLVKRYAELLGGTVSLSGQINVGTMFVVEIPLQQKREEAAP